MMGKLKKLISLLTLLALMTGFLVIPVYAEEQTLVNDDFSSYTIDSPFAVVTGKWRKINRKTNSVITTVNVAEEGQPLNKALLISAALGENPYITGGKYEFNSKRAVIQFKAKIEGEGGFYLTTKHDETHILALKFRENGANNKIGVHFFDNATGLQNVAPFKTDWYNVVMVVDTTIKEDPRVDLTMDGVRIKENEPVAALKNVSLLEGVKFDTYNGGKVYIDDFKITVLADDQSIPDDGRTMPVEVNLDDYPPHDMVTPPLEHPRLFITNDIAEEIRGKLNHPEMHGVWQRIINVSGINHDGVLDKTLSRNYNVTVRKAIEANAMRYILEGNQASGEKAVQMMKNMLKTVTFGNVSDVTRDKGQVLLTAGIVYDWCYDLIDPAEKTEWVALIETLASDMAIGYPPRDLSVLVGHSSEAQLLRDQLGAGVAIYDEKPDMYNSAAGRILSKYVPARNFWYQSHMYHQGTSYGTYRFQWDLFATFIFDRMGFGNVFSDEQGQTPYRWLYSRRPDGQLLRDGDASLPSKHLAGSYFNYTTTTLLAAGYYKDPILKAEFLTQYSNHPWDTEDIFYILFNDPSVRPASQETLPLTKYFPSPGGSMIARTGWGLGKDSDDVVVEMKVSEFAFNNHQHLDAGSFQIYYKGALAIDSGLYQGTNAGYGKPHDINYQKRTIAHNSMLVQDPGEKFYFGSTEVANDGGQRWPLNAKEPFDLDELITKGVDTNTAAVMAHDFGPDPVKPAYSYLKGNLTNAYSDKISNYNRSFVFLNLEDENIPAAFIVYDNITSSDKEFKKTWLLHSMEVPEIDGSRIVVSRAENGYNGKLIDDVLLPEAANIQKIGGPGEEFLVNGVNYPASPTSNKNSDEVGAWRVEVSPKEKAASDVFLNVMQIMDGDYSGQPLNNETVSTDQFNGVKLGSKVVLFAKGNNKVSDAFQLKLGDAEEKLAFIITDVASGVWRVTGQGFSQNIPVSNQTGVLYVEAPPGEYSYVKINDEAPGAGSNPSIPQKQLGIRMKYGVEYINADPVMVGGEVLIPLRSVAEKLGMNVNYNEADQSVTLQKDEVAIWMQVDNSVAVVNGEQHQMDVPARVITETMYVPVRLVSEALGAYVEWDENASIMLIIPDFTAKGKTNGAVSWSLDDGNEGINAVDGRLDTRWSAEGDGQWIQFDLGERKLFNKVGIAWYKATERTSRFSLYISDDARKWKKIHMGESTGLTAGVEDVYFEPVQARYLRIVGHGNSANWWNSITEVELPADTHKADSSRNRITLDRDRVTAGETVTLAVYGDRQSAEGIVTGDERFTSIEYPVKRCTVPKYGLRIWNTLL